MCYSFLQLDRRLLEGKGPILFLAVSPNLEQCLAQRQFSVKVRGMEQGEGELEGHTQASPCAWRHYTGSVPRAHVRGGGR